MKYALHLNLATNGVSGLPVNTIVTVSGSNYPALTYTKVKAAMDLTKMRLNFHGLGGCQHHTDKLSGSRCDHSDFFNRISRGEVGANYLQQVRSDGLPISKVIGGL